MNRRRFLSTSGNSMIAGSAALGVLGGLAATPRSGAAHEGEVGPSAVFQIEELLNERAEKELLYHGFFKAPTLHLGIYHLKAGGTDLQFPHNEDEIYYVIEGEALLEVENEIHEVKPGRILYVRAHAKHKFKDITSPLTLLVFFSRAPVP